MSSGAELSFAVSVVAFFELTKDGGVSAIANTPPSSCGIISPLTETNPAYTPCSTCRELVAPAVCDYHVENQP